LSIAVSVPSDPKEKFDIKKAARRGDLAALFILVTIIVFMGGPGRGVIEFQKIPPYPMATIIFR